MLWSDLCVKRDPDFNGAYCLILALLLEEFMIRKEEFLLPYGASKIDVEAAGGIAGFYVWLRY